METPVSVCPLCVLLRDAASRRELLSVIAQLADSQPDILVSSLLYCLLNSGVISKGGQPRYCSELYIAHVVILKGYSFTA